MKKIFTLMFVSLAMFAQADSWIQIANFPGVPRRASIAFSIGFYGYVGGGLDSNNHSLIDFWEYDPNTDHWTQRANLPSNNFYWASAFSINNKGYVCIQGTTGENLWEYDQATNLWTQKATIAGQARMLPIGFSIGNKGYFGTGGTNLGQNDLWQWDQPTNTWTQMSSMPAGGINAAVGFSINDKGYVSTGFDGWEGSTNMWEFDPSANTWVLMTDLPGIGRFSAIAFSVCDKGYVGTGGYPTLNDFWQFDPIQNQWIQKTNVHGFNRYESVSFTIGYNGYVGLGDSGAATGFLNDFWKYTPDNICAITTNLKENLGIYNISIYPNPTNNTLTIHQDTYFPNQQVVIIDVIGNRVYSQALNNDEETMDISHLVSGIYFYEINGKRGKIIKE